MKRIFLFLLTNIAVLVVISVIIGGLGLNGWLSANGIDYRALLVFSAVIGFTGSFISLLLSKFMAKMVYGVRAVDPATRDPELSWLYETTQRLARQAGLRMPEVGVYESPEANAFATGPRRSNALVAVSSGLFNTMNHRQIEAVLGHEISHVANGDMVTMTLLQGVLNTFVIFLSRVAGFFIDAALRGNSDRRGPGIGFFIASLVCQIFLSILASMIVMAYSRHREFRADAGAARLCGAEYMIDALAALQRVSQGGAHVDERSKSLAAFKINGRPSGFMALLSSHPPIEARIEALKKGSR